MSRELLSFLWSYCLPTGSAFQPDGEGRGEGKIVLLLLIPWARTCLHHICSLPIDQNLVIWRHPASRKTGMWVLVLLLNAHNCCVIEKENGYWGNAVDSKAPGCLRFCAHVKIFQELFENNDWWSRDSREVSCRAPRTRGLYWICSSWCDLRKILGFFKPQLLMSYEDITIDGLWGTHAKYWQYYSEPEQA